MKSNLYVVVGSGDSEPLGLVPLYWSVSYSRKTILQLLNVLLCSNPASADVVLGSGDSVPLGTSCGSDCQFYYNIRFNDLKMNIFYNYLFLENYFSLKYFCCPVTISVFTFSMDFSVCVFTPISVGFDFWFSYSISSSL